MARLPPIGTYGVAVEQVEPRDAVIRTGVQEAAGRVEDAGLVVAPQQLLLLRDRQLLEQERGALVGGLRRVAPRMGAAGTLRPRRGGDS